ncbi:MAG: BglII/BstYI family type II restriction endonuclease [Candidatus Aenigmarchaeota archaeon]|nr:BglII/BstYI family type II restriction endonuclease [Candidatus Aenigmarchaeota archaeon]
MIVAGKYSFNHGEEIIEQAYPELLKEIQEVIKNIDASKHINKESKEKTMPGQMLYSPVSLNNAFKNEFKKYGWGCKRIKCDYPTQYYTGGYAPKGTTRGAFREMDFIKEKLGVEVQFGKYAFMVYNVAAKMTIFHNLGFIDMGVEIVPMKQFANNMSTGVSYFEQFVWDLEHRGVSNIDIPVLIYGIDKSY